MILVLVGKWVVGCGEWVGRSRWIRGTMGNWASTVTDIAQPIAALLATITKIRVWV